MSKLVSVVNLVVFLVLGCVATDSRAYAATLGYWRFEETSGATAVDSSGNGNNGSLIGSITRSSDVPVNPIPETNAANQGSISLANTFAFVDVPQAAVLNPTSAITVEAWVRLTGNPASFATAIAGRQYGDDNKNSFNLFARNNNSSIGFEITNSVGGEAAAEVFTGLTPNQWYHLAGSYDGSAINLYVDGVLAATTPFSGDIGYAVSKPLLIGADNEGGPVNPTFTFPGNIDEVRISDVALLPSQFLSSPVPEPSTLALAGMGVIALLARGLRRRPAL